MLSHAGLVVLAALYPMRLITQYMVILVWIIYKLDENHTNLVYW
jgi:hypothetical protein